MIYLTILLTTYDCRWIAGKISEILGNEDDVVIELCFNLLEGSRFVRAHPRSPFMLQWADSNLPSLISKCCKSSLPAFLIRIRRNSARNYGYSASVRRVTHKAFRKSYWRPKNLN